MSDSIRGDDKNRSIKETEYERYVKRIIAEGYHLNDQGYWVKPNPTDHKIRTDKTVIDGRDKAEVTSERIADADIRNRRLLPNYIPQKEELTKEDDDIVKYATVEDIENIKKVLLKILAVLDIIKESLTKKVSTKKRGGRIRTV